jgi:gamma-glutamylcyclotransferase (GGCT)/AIG2-like uncharacterized protein YtfP
MAAVFVYGTLMPGRLRWPILEPYSIGFRDAAVPGALYDSGQGWPLAVFGHEGAGPRGGVVPGVLVELDPVRVDEVLLLLDHVEDTVAGVFERRLVETTDGAPAWTYHCLLDVSGLERIERWEGRPER